MGRIFGQHRPVPSELERDGHRRFALHGNRVRDHAHVLPGAVVLVLIRIRRVGVVHVEIFRVRPEDGQPPRAVLIVTDRNARQHRFASADHVPAWRDQMHPVAQRRGALVAMRIVHHQRIAALGPCAAHHPVVAADVLVPLAQLDGRRLLGRRCRAERKRPPERVVQIEDRRVQQREIDRPIRRDVRIAPLKVLQLLHLLGAEHADGLRDVQLLADVGEQRVVPRDDDIGRPRRRPDPEHGEFDRQPGRIRQGPGDVRVHAADIRSDDRFAARVIPVQLRLEIAAEHVQPRADVALQLLAAEDLRDRAGRLAAPQLELEQPIARGGVALREEQIALALRVDVIDAPAVAQDLDRLTQPVDTQRGAGGRRAGRAGGRSQDASEENHFSHGAMLARATMPLP